MTSSEALIPEKVKNAVKHGSFSGHFGEFCLAGTKWFLCLYFHQVPIKYGVV